jgi:hypothetical protein
MKQSVGVRSLEISLDPLWAEHAAVEGEVFPWLEADDLVASHLELDSALLSAEAAMCFDELVWLVRARAARSPR